MDLAIKLDHDDVIDIENDLSLQEKVSVAFLLCKDELEVDYFLQQLVLLVTMNAENRTHSTTMLLEWSRRSDDWSAILIESLCVAQCNHVILKLGLNLNKLTLFHYPTRPEIATNVHPGIKLLYLLCERMTTSESVLLLARIKNRFASQLSSLDIDVPGMLEIHLLHCISQKIIRVFGEKLEFNPLIETFKEIDHLDFYDFLKSNVEKYKGLLSDKDTNYKETPSIRLQMNLISEPEQESHESYSINRNSPGVLLIINQFKFYTETDPNLSYLLPSKPLDERKGTEKDVAALKKTFEQFNFKIILKADLRHDEILIAIREVIGAMTRSDSSLFVAVLSHGIEGCVFGSNSIPLEVREIKNQIYSCADHMLGRPKCLIVQACQGQDLQISKLVENHLQTDSPSVPRPVLTIPPCSDFLIAWSTVEGFASLRHVLTGTWFIQTLCQTIDEHYARKHLVDILTLVNNRIAGMKGNRNESMIPKIESTLRKKFIFPAANSPST